MSGTRTDSQTERPERPATVRRLAARCFSRCVTLCGHPQRCGAANGGPTTASLTLPHSVVALNARFFVLTDERSNTLRFVRIDERGAVASIGTIHTNNSSRSNSRSSSCRSPNPRSVSTPVSGRRQGRASQRAGGTGRSSEVGVWLHPRGLAVARVQSGSGRWCPSPTFAPKRSLLDRYRSAQLPPDAAAHANYQDESQLEATFVLIVCDSGHHKVSIDASCDADYHVCCSLSRLELVRLVFNTEANAACLPPP
jgi:hypothetical protein